jgi:hypothetical protein
MTICRLIDMGLVAYDLLAHPSAFKKSWSNSEIPLRTVIIPFSWIGRIYAETWIPKVRPVLKRYYDTSPLPIRKLVNAAQSLT